MLGGVSGSHWPPLAFAQPLFLSRKVAGSRGLLFLLETISFYQSSAPSSGLCTLRTSEGLAEAKLKKYKLVGTGYILLPTDATKLFKAQ